MMEFTKVSRTLFRKSRKFKALDDDGRLLYLYLLVNEHITSAGCYQLEEGYALTDMKWELARFIKTMETLNIGGLISWDRDAGTVLIEGWMSFNEPANARHAVGMLSCLDDVDSTLLKLQRVNELRPLIISKKLCNERVVGNDLAVALRAYPESKVSQLAQRQKTETQDLDREKEQEKEEDLDLDAARRSALAEGPSGLAPTLGTHHLLQTGVMRKTA